MATQKREGVCFEITAAMATRVVVSFVGIALLLTTSLAQQSAPFSYSGATGPEKWGSLNPNFSSCSTGKYQSPVNIVKKEVVLKQNLEPLTRDYHPANATLINNGFNIGIKYEEGVGVLVIDKKNYSLRQMHWHSPSEHRINGVQYSLELHLVHVADDGSISVVSILYKYGNPNPLLSQIKDQLDEMAKEVSAGNKEARIPLGIMKIKQIKRKTKKYYRYMGSLTTPPCTGNVIWTILGKVRSVSKEQVAALKAPLNWPCKNNCRPSQPLNGRQIQLYDALKLH
ncbi:hypothetical protein HHK36_011401 [Tetracentron sinense]|uniref:Carbonic anhydrase n=1 Tax=Tetracentron sinense TaxID=13715 RepID=A0A834Z846_TETSI|nr:hypothetical protein HHK36_011401 [Tetracentron sinense]